MCNFTHTLKVFQFVNISFSIIAFMFQSNHISGENVHRNALVFDFHTNFCDDIVESMGMRKPRMGNTYSFG